MAESEGNGAPGVGNGGARRGGGGYSGPRAHDPAPPDDHHDDPAFISRTKFLTGVALATGGVLTAAILVPVIGFAVAPTLEPEEWRWIDIGAVGDFPDGEVSSVAASGPAAESDRRVFLRRKEGTLIGMWNRCTHLGCPVAYSAGGDNYVCPCHGGAYDSLGRVTGGPPVRPFDRFDLKVVRGDRDIAKADPSGAVKLDGAQPDDRVLLGKVFSVDDELRPYRLHGPGEPVEGVLSNLYPF